MNARSILTTLFRNNSSDHRQKRRRNLRQPTAAETLEQRTLLTTYVVEGPEHVSANIVERADNSGSLSARSLLAAIEHANANPGPDTIRFSEFFDDPQTIVLVKPSESVGEEIVITGDLTIVGPGADKLLITGDGFGANDADGNDFGDLFEVGPFATVEIFGVQLAGGFNGAVIRNEGFLTLDNVHVTDSSSTAIQNFGTLHVQDSTFTRIDGGQGGGIGSFDGTVNVENSLFTDSYSLLGGALYAENTDLTVVNSTFSGNTANLDGGAISITGGTTRLTNNTIVNNHVLVDSVGGGIVFNDEVAANQSHLANNIIAGNTREFSTDTDILVEPNDIDFFAGGTLSSSNRNNLIGDPNSAGGLVHGANGNILGDGDGGLLDLDGVLDVTLRDLGGPTPVHPLVVDSPAIDAGDNSEAIGLDGGPMLSDQRGYPHRRIVNETITQTAQVDIGAYEVQDVVSRPSPDAIVVSIIDDESDGNFAPDDLSLREAVELANRSLDHNTIFFNEDVRGTIDLNERPLFIGGGLTINGPGERPVDLSGFSEPERQNILNSTLTIDGGDQNHLLHIYNNAEAKVSRLTLLNGNGGQFSGGAIVNNGSLLAEDLVVGESSALTGGGIFNGPTATLDIRRSTIEGNSATLTTSSGVGGGIENQGYLKLEEVFITNNQATQGGGVSSESGNESFPAVTTIIGSVFEGNAGRDVSTLASSGRGGGFRNQGGVATVIESAFLRNRASSGAGIYSSGGPIEVIHSDISHNAAQQFGGGAEIQSPDHHSTIFGSTFANNTGGSGGGVALNVHPDGAGGGSITLSNSTVSQNHTGTFGGGVAVEGNAPGAEVRIRDTTIAFNESDLGGGLANNGALTELDNTILSNNIGRNRGAEYVELFFGNLPNVPRHIVVQDYVAAEWTNSTALEDGDNRNLLGVDPKLVPTLATVPGSFTATHALQVDSPAIDAGSSDRLVDQAGQRALEVPNRQNQAVFIQVPENKHTLPRAEPVTGRMAIDFLAFTIDGVTFRMTSVPGQGFLGEETIFVSLPTNWVSGGYDATEHKRVADLIVDAINNHPSLDHVAAVVRGDVANGLDAQLDSWFTPFWGWNELLLSGAAPGTNPRVNHHPLFIEIIGANSVSSSTDPENTPDGHPGDYESVIERGNRAELYPTGIADIGAFEAQISVIEDDWTSEVIGHSQFGNSGSPAQVGLGYTVPRSTTIPTEPGFLGFDFNPDPFTFGGIGEGWFGDKYGGEVRADIRIKAGLEYGYYANAGTVDVYYDGLFNWEISDPGDGSEVMINTRAEITDGSLYTISPRFGAYVDIVFELEVNIGGAACFIDCLEGELPPIDISIRENLFSVNRQLEDANGRRLFERSDGSTTTDVAQGIAPALDGEIKFLGASAIEKLLEKVDEKVGESLKQEREERQRAEIGQAEAEKDLAKATSDEERQALNQIIDERKREAAEASKNEKSLTKKKAASGASTSLCVSSGIGVEACFGEKEGDLLGLEATLSASVSTGGADGGKFGVGKELGSLSVSVPDIQLTDQTIDAANRLTATTADFAPASKADRDRQIANLTFDIAGLLGPQLGIPAGKYTVDLGPLSLGAQLLSYNIETLLGLTQTVEVTPAITSTAVTFSSPVTINGSQTTMHSFVPGERFDVDPVNNNSPVTVTPSMRLQNTFHNDVGLDITMNGIFEALSLSLSAFGSDFVDVGPLIRDVHNLGNIDIGSVFDRTFNLDTEPVTGFESFQIGAGQDKESAPTDGDTPTTAFFARPDNGDEAEFVVTPQVNDSLDEYFVSVPLNNGDGASYSGVAFTVRGDGSSQLNAVSVAHPGIRLIPNSSSGGGFIMEPGQWYPAQWFQMVVTETAQLEGDLLFGIRSWGGTAEVSWLDRVDPPPVPAVGTTGDEIDAAELRAANDQLTTELSDSDEALDVDGDGTTDALTDGQLIIRYANGQRGEALVNGLVSPNASRDTAAIEQHLAALMAEPDRLNLNDDANAFDLNTDGRLLLQVMAGSDAEVPEDVIKRLRGGRTSGIDTTRLSNSGFVSRTSGDVIGPQADSSAEEAAVPGASALNPLKLNGNSNNRSVELTGFSQATAFRETYVHSADDVTQRTLVARGAVGTPQKPTGVGPDDPTDQDSILEFSRRLQTETTTATLGVEEPIYVAMPLADQWEIEAPAGTTISGLVFVNSAGDNGYFDFQRPADESDVDFEIFLPDSDQRFNVMMSNEGQVIPLPDVQRFVLLRNGLPLAAQRGVPADEVRFLNLSLGMQLASNDPAPRLNVTLTNPVPEPPAPPTPDQGQAITLTVDRDVVQFGQQVNVAPLYHVTGTPASGPGALTFRVHYDSSRFTFENGSSNFSSFDTIRDVAETVPDGDLNTDRTVELSWFDPTGSELNNTTPEEIVNLVFTANTEAGTTSFHATRSDSAVWDFTSTSAAVDVTPITFVVDNVGDVSDGNFSSGQLTLREAIEQATAGGGGSRIEFSEQLSQITLSDQLPEIQSDITITGPGADLLTINAASSRRHLYVFNEGTLTLSGVTLQGGNVVGSTLDSAGSLLNAGVTKLDGVRLIDNSARFGGAVANIGTLRISNSELSGNHATSSGGAASLGEDVLIVNSTISGNTSDGNAGGLSVEDGTIVVRNSTIVGNRSNADGANGGTAGGIHQISSGQVTLHNTIVAGNREVLNGGIGDIPCDIVGVVQPESSHNLVTDPNTSGGLSAANGNIIGNGSGAVLPLATVVESQLTGEGPRSHVLAANSPAIDAGSNAQVFDVNDQFVLSADQTGAARVFGGTIDIGAVENVPLAAFTVTPPQSDNVTEAGSTTTASVVLNAPPTGNVVFSIDSSDIGEAVVSPAILTFSPGNWDQPQSLTITGVDDSVADGDRASSITLAVSEGPDAFTVLPSQSFNVVTRDDEVAQLTVTIDSDSIVESEGSHAAMATVTRNSDTSEELRVNIVSSDTSEVIAPTPIIIPAGQTTSGPFLVSAVDDSDVDGTQTVTLTASAPGHAEGTDTIVVIDDDTNARPGNIDGDDDFDASDTFLIQLVQLSGNNQQIDQTKGASPRTAEEIRAAIAQLATTGDVDGDNHFDANDAFLIHLVQLSGTNAAIDQSKGASPLSAAEIRANIEELGGRNNQQSASQPIHQVTLHAYNAIHRTIPPTLFDWDESQRSDVAAGKFSNQIDRPLYDEVLSDFRSWVDVL